MAATASILLEEFLSNKLWKFHTGSFLSEQWKKEIQTTHQEWHLYAYKATYCSKSSLNLARVLSSKTRTPIAQQDAQV
jgi:hypothetical protein